MPRKIDPNDKEEVQQAYIVSGEEIESKTIYYAEDSVVKEFDRLSVHTDYWPIHELKEVTAKDERGKIANLLLCARDGHKFEVTGQIIVDAEFKQYLRTYRKKGFTNLNGSFILVEKPDNISMGYAPLTLWVSSKCGWLEISPSAEYRSMYESIMHVIGLYFCVIVHAEDLATDGEGESHSVSQEIQDIMMTYIKGNGAGVTVVEVIEACKESKDFLLDQFRKKVISEYWVGKVHGIKWIDNAFYRWVVAHFPENLADTLPVDPEMAKAGPPAKYAPFKPTPKKSPTPPAAARPTQSTMTQASPPIANTPPPQQVVHGAFPPGMSATVTFDVPGGASMTIPRWPWTRKETSGTWSRAITSHHGVYSSPEYPQGLKPEMDNVEVIVVVGCHARSCDRYAELNAANLSGAFYWDFKCDDNRASRQVVNFYAKQIAARFLSLSPDWKETAVYKGLQEAVFDITGLKPKEVLKVKALTTGGQKVEHRTSRKALVQSFDVSSSSASILPTAMSALTVSGGGTIKKRGSNSPPPATQTMKKARYDESMVSTSRDPSPIPSGEEPTKFDGLGKRIPKPIKRSHY